MVNSILDINGTKINVVDWETENPKAVLLIVHGYAEHSHRYDHVAKFFNSHSFHVRSFDFLWPWQVRWSKSLRKKTSIDMWEN